MAPSRKKRRLSRRHMPDLCLLALIKQIDALDRITAQNVSSTWFHRVREANRAVRSLTIAVGTKDDFKAIDERINGLSIESEPSMMLLKRADGSKLYPLRHVATKWNCLRFGELNSSTVRQIIATFPHITELVFVNRSTCEEYQYQYLVAMLTSENWRKRLTTFKLICSPRVVQTQGDTGRVRRLLSGQLPLSPL